MKAHALYLIITNKQVDGFSLLYFSNTNSTAAPAETGQIWCGQNTGLNIGTDAAHTIRLSDNRSAADAVNSKEILGTGGARC